MPNFFLFWSKMKLYLYFNLDFNLTAVITCFIFLLDTIQTYDYLLITEIQGMFPISYKSRQILMSKYDLIYKIKIGKQL